MDGALNGNIGGALDGTFGDSMYVSLDGAIGGSMNGAIGGPMDGVHLRVSTYHTSIRCHDNTSKWRRRRRNDSVTKSTSTRHVTATQQNGTPRQRNR